MIVPFPSVVESTDLAEREAALDIHSSCIVEAPAGSGKTGLLIQRYLKLLASVDDPSELLALTFTTKATAEMVDRVVNALRTAAAGQEPFEQFQRLTFRLARAVLARDAERGWALLDHPHLLNIRTIDSLCSAIVRSVPLTSGDLAGAQPVADPRPLYLEAAHAVMMRFGGDDEVLNAAIHDVLMHRDGDLVFCERVLSEMLATRDQWGTLVPLSERLTEEYLETVTLPRLNSSLERTVCNVLEQARNAFDDDVLHEISRIAERHAFEPGHKEETNPLVVCAGRQHAPGCNLEDLQHWQALAKLLLTKDGFRAAFHGHLVGTAIQREDAARLKEILSNVQCDELYDCLHAVRAFKDTAYPADQWHVSKALFRLLGYALVELKLLFARRQVCDFTEVSLAARSALSAHEGTPQEVLGTRLSHLLVDEMQDTSAGQYDLLEQLTAGWDGSSQTVFLVGDPKQSIYLFRQARVDRFQQCMSAKKLGDITLEVLLLRTNFRSGRTLVNECNETFRTIFPQSNPPDGDVVFHEASAANEPKAGEGMHWKIEAIPKEPKDLAENRRRRRNAVRREARDTAELLRTAWNAWSADAERRQHTGDARHVPFRAAVLTRARTHVIEIAKELDKAGLPYRAVDLKPLAEQQEVLDLVAITRALSHPADRIAWMAVLRAPWCGLELAHLHTLAAGDDPAHRNEALRHHLRERGRTLPQQAQTRLFRTLDVLDASLEHTGVESLGHRVERTWRSLGGDLYTTPLQQENIREYLRVLHAMERDGEAFTLKTLDLRLARLFARPSNAPDAIDIMTIHRAKGLEWDLVILPGLHRTPARDGYAALEWIELPTRAPDGSGDVLLAPLPGKGEDAGALLDFIRARKRARSYAEVKRLFYVAATRARTALYLFASPESTLAGNTQVTVGTLLKAAWPAAQQYATVRQLPTSAVEPSASLAIAASAEIIPFPAPVNAPPIRLPDIQRLPDTVDPLARLRATHRSYGPQRPATPAFARPVGSFGARAVGNAIHVFVERLANELAAHVAAGASMLSACHLLMGTVQTWQPAVQATLRSASLPPGVVDRASRTVLRALENLLRSEDGRWVLMPHAHGDYEAAWRAGARGEERRIRLDRSFFAGPAPHAPGADTFWIIDFKTGDRTGPNETLESREAFLAAERAKYEGQLRTYAQVRSSTLPAGTPIMLGLFYPLLDQLLWWRYHEAVLPPRSPANDAPSADDIGQFSLFP